MYFYFSSFSKLIFGRKNVKSKCEKSKYFPNKFVIFKFSFFKSIFLLQKWMVGRVRHTEKRHSDSHRADRSTDRLKWSWRKELLRQLSDSDLLFWSFSFSSRNNCSSVDCRNRSSVRFYLSWRLDAYLSICLFVYLHKKNCF
jgi:hypothetical protein